MKLARGLPAVLGLLVFAAGAAANPPVTSAIFKTRVENLGPATTLTTVNSYPSLLSISDFNGPAYDTTANVHVWRFSSDGINAATFHNEDAFRFCADVTLTGDGEGSAGLQIAPYGDLNRDGYFSVRTFDGQIDALGRYLPYYSFTDPAHGGLHYVKGTTIRMECIYLPNDLSSTNPATIEYKVTYEGNTYTSGPRPWGQGTSPGDPHGQWGMMTPANVGGHLWFYLSRSLNRGVTATWRNVCYDPFSVAVTPSAWGAVKGLYR